MDLFMIVFWIVGSLLMIFSVIKSKQNTVESMKKSKKMMGNMIGDIIAIIMLIGLILTLVPVTLIQDYLGASSVFLSTIAASLVGSVTLIPAFVAFPLVGSFVDSGASIVPAAAFLTTLTMVGVATFPLEKKEFGLKFAIYRNGMSFVAAVIIALGMGVILSWL